jgi:REP element-mobilizing transposase RayT
MGQSLVQTYVHLVFSTKHRKPLIIPPFEDELHNYLGGVCNELNCQSIIVGSYTDHVHILYKQSQKIALMKLVEEVKKRSSKWIKEKHPLLSNFYWQNGYAAFSVDPKNMDGLISYIANQHEHHSKNDFQNELRSMLIEHFVEFDEKYVWD